MNYKYFHPETPSRVAEGGVNFGLLGPEPQGRGVNPLRACAQPSLSSPHCFLRILRLHFRETWMKVFSHWNANTGSSSTFSFWQAVEAALFQKEASVQGYFCNEHLYEKGEPCFCESQDLILRAPRCLVWLGKEGEEKTTQFLFICLKDHTYFNSEPSVLCSPLVGLPLHPSHSVFNFS